ncbi:peptide chain release factor 1 [Desulfocarbo indianensis]|nr:peptide chain release factor 1 [Desulfocarbo indianensis]
MREQVVDKLKEATELHRKAEERLADPQVLANNEVYQKVAKEHSDLSRLVDAFNEYNELERQLEDNRELMRDEDPELAEMAAAEVAAAEERLPELEKEIDFLLLPKDPNDEKNVILEVRAGTGGEEAALFAADLFRMYNRLAERQSWQVEMMSAHESATGGFKEVIALIKGNGAYSWLKYESGVHRVQRVPETESQGRVHTSAATVAVLPEAEEAELDIKSDDLRIDVFRSSGPGGQHVNKTESAVRITHLPTGLVVSCQDEKSQHKNKAKAMKVLSARLKDRLDRERHAEEAQARKSQVGSGDRSERIRTYNFPQGRVSDHRIGLTLYKLENIMDGDLDELVPPLATHFRSLALEDAL